MWGIVPTSAVRGSQTETETVAWSVLTSGLSDESPERRMQAVAALGTIGPTDRVLQLCEWALRDSEAGVRQIAAAKLGEMHARASIPALRTALADKHPEVSFTAAKALWDMGDQSGREIFTEVLAGERSDNHEGMSGAVHEAKLKFRDPKSLAVTGAKEAAGYALGPFAYGIPVVQDLMKDSSASARALSATYLSADSDPASLPALERALGDDNWVVRVAAVKAVAARGDANVINTLLPLFRDEKHAVRYMAAASVIRLSSAPAK